DLAETRNQSALIRTRVAGAITILGCLVAILWLSQANQRIHFADGMLVLDALPALLKQFILLLTIFTTLLSLESHSTDHVGEYYLLLLLATAGMMFLVSTENILMIFLSLELLSVC